MSEKYFEKALADFTVDFASGGAILLNEPEKEASPDRVTYEKVQDEYGRTSFKQVVIPGDKVLPEYVKCDFGKHMYQDPAKFAAWLATLPEDDRDYIEGLPWPLQPVWHVRNERMERVVTSQPDMKGG